MVTDKVYTPDAAARNLVTDVGVEVGSPDGAATMRRFAGIHRLKAKR
jgi:hypothetical protein